MLLFIFCSWWSWGRRWVQNHLQVDRFCAGHLYHTWNPADTNQHLSDTHGSPAQERAPAGINQKVMGYQNS